VFFLFSLGPYLNIGGTYWEPFGRRIPLPFLALFEAIPLFDRISHPFRFVVGVSLGTAIGAAVGLRHALRNQSRARQILVVGGLIGATLLETRYLSPASLPIPVSDAHIPTAYTEMAEDPTPGAVLDLPMAVPNLERAIYVWFQAAHGRPVPWGLNEPMPAPLLKNRLTATLIRIEATRARSLPPRLPELDLVVAGRALRREGYRYIVLHQDLYPRFKSEMTEAVLRGAFGEPRAVPEDHLLIWTLEPLP
jgi:pimeloyl-ACP methyl ester carboxylesterase